MEDVYTVIEPSINAIDRTLTLKGSLEGGLLLDGVLGEHQDDRQMSKDHEKSANTKFSHRPAMYMHTLAPIMFTFAFLGNQPTNFLIDYRLSREFHRRVETHTKNPRLIRISHSPRF